MSLKDSAKSTRLSFWGLVFSYGKSFTLLNQTWLAGKSPKFIDDFPSYNYTIQKTPPFLIGDFPSPLFGGVLWVDDEVASQNAVCIMNQ